MSPSASDVALLGTQEECAEFLSRAAPQQVALQLFNDREATLTDGIPSHLALFFPLSPSPRNRSIARHLINLIHPQADDSDVGVLSDRAFHGTQHERLSAIVSSIRRYIDKLQAPPPALNQTLPNQLIPTDADLEGALKVLQYLSIAPEFARKLDPKRTSIPEVQGIISYLHAIPESEREYYSAQSAKFAYGHPGKRKATRPARRQCYICQHTFTISHPAYLALCPPCGAFNISSCKLSSPENLDLRGRAAFVTGARVNLGYHITLALLRAGCFVIVTTRYPFAAEKAYFAEPDFEDWKDRLKLLGADFRRAADVFSLVKSVRKVIEERGGKLDILINNAAQTLVDSVEKEESAIRREWLLEGGGGGALVGDCGYKPRVRGGIEGRATMGLEDGGLEEVLDSEPSTPHSHLNGEIEHPNSTAVTTTTLPQSSSWTQTLETLPYDDLITAHSTNTFTPLILIKELTSLLAVQPLEKLRSPTAYIINVSSREGISENSPTSRAKAGHHPHNNMSKAALGMLTETIAREYWENYRIAVNTVDPGFMSSDPVYVELRKKRDQEMGRKTARGEDIDNCPIGWEDGVGRVLWPIGVAEGKEVDGGRRNIWGRFLRQFEEVKVPVGRW